VKKKQLLVTDKEVRRLFNNFNKEYFDNSLSKEMRIEFVRNPMVGKDRVDGYQLGEDIVLRESLRSHYDSVVITLIHEMIHADLPHYVGNRRMAGVHGTIFQAKVVQLFNAGIYDGLL
jgi:hypothetical protein